MSKLELTNMVKAYVCICANLTFAQSTTLALDESQPILIKNVNVVTELDNNNNDPFGDGWETGFCEGWKDVKGRYSYCPYAPYAPYPNYNCGDSYRCGYNRGFKYGRCKAQGYSNCKK